MAQDEISARLPVLLQELVVELGDTGPGAAALDAAKQPVRVRAELVVEAAVLLGALDAAGDDLRDVDVDDVVGGGVWGLGRGRVLGHVEGDGGGGEGLAGEPADALEGEDGLNGVGEGLVLRGDVSFGSNGKVR